MAKHTGSVTWFNNSKGYSFLKANGTPDVFCRYSSIQHNGYKSLKEGELVDFDVESGAKGPQAATVRRLTQKDATSIKCWLRCRCSKCTLCASARSPAGNSGFTGQVMADGLAVSLPCKAGLCSAEMASSHSGGAL